MGFDANPAKPSRSRTPPAGDVIANRADLSPAPKSTAAIAVADKARNRLGRATGKARAAVMRNGSDLMMEHQEEFGDHHDRPNRQAFDAKAGGEVAYARATSNWFGGRGNSGFTVKPFPPRSKNKRIMVIQAAHRRAAAITRGTFPTPMIAPPRCAPALARRLRFIVRPASLTPLSALAMGKLAEEAWRAEKVVFFLSVPRVRPSKSARVCENPIVRNTHLLPDPPKWAASY